MADKYNLLNVVKFADIGIHDQVLPIRTEEESKIDYISKQNNLTKIEQEVHCIPCDQIIEFNLEILNDHVRMRDHRQKLFSTMDKYFDLQCKEILSKKLVYFHRIFIIDEDTVACKICDEVMPKIFAWDHSESNEHRLSLAKYFEQIYDSQKLHFSLDKKRISKHSFVETSGKTGDEIVYKLPELNAQFPDCNDFELEEENHNLVSKELLKPVSKSWLVKNHAAIDELIYGPGGNIADGKTETSH